MMFFDRQRGTIMTGIERTNRLSVDVMEMDEKIIQLQNEVALLRNEIHKLKELIRGDGK